MILSGLVMLAFVPIHIDTFKFGKFYEWAGHDHGRDLYRLVIEIFHKPLYVLWYLIALPVLGAHAWHGFGSAFESLGMHYRPWLAGFGRALAVILTVGFMAVPIYVYFFTGARRDRRRSPARRQGAGRPDREQVGASTRAISSLVNPANRRKYEVIVVGTGLAGASAAASLGELGYNVKAFTILDSPRRAHSIAAQGGINAAKNYKNDGDSVYRLFYDTIKGGDYRAREGNVHRLAELSVEIIDQCVAQGVPFAREYGGLLAYRSFGGAQVSRTFYARGQTGQQLLFGAYQAMMRQVDAGRVTMLPRREMLDLVLVDGQRARGHRPQPRHGRARAPRRARGAALHRRLRQRVLPLDQRRQLQRHGDVALRAPRRLLRQSGFRPDPSDVHPGDRRVSVEADAHERELAQRRPRLGAHAEG